MDCLLHQVLVAMLTVTPVPDDARLAETQPRSAITRPADIKASDAKKGIAVKKNKGVALAARANSSPTLAIN